MSRRQKCSEKSCSRSHALAVTRPPENLASHASSTSTVLTQVVDKVATTTTLTSSLNPANYNQSVTLTATVGAADATGEVALSHGDWSHPAQPAAIGVPTADFHANRTTLKVRLLMRTNAPAGVHSVWFDGLTLERSDVIFADGFD